MDIEISRLIALFSNRLDISIISEANEMLNNSEYLLAVDVLCESIHEEDIRLTERDKKELRECILMFGEKYINDYAYIFDTKVKDYSTNNAMMKPDVYAQSIAHCDDPRVFVTQMRKQGYSDIIVTRELRRIFDIPFSEVGDYI